MQYMKHVAKKCRKLKSGCICFSPESVIWIKREQIYKSLVKYHLGRNKNRGNMKRAARKQGIKELFKNSMAELKTRLEVCEERNNHFRKHGAWYRKKHLLKRAKIAREDGREEAAKKFWPSFNASVTSLSGEGLIIPAEN